MKFAAALHKGTLLPRTRLDLLFNPRRHVGNDRPRLEPDAPRRPPRSLASQPHATSQHDPLHASRPRLRRCRPGEPRRRRASRPRPRHRRRRFSLMEDPHVADARRGVRGIGGIGRRRRTGRRGARRVVRHRDVGGVTPPASETATACTPAHSGSRLDSAARR